MANIGDSQDDIIWGTDFGCMTDIKFGPDGLMYIVSLSDGTIYRIVPKELATQVQATSSLPYIAVGVTAGAAVAGIYVGRARKRMTLA